MDPGHAGHRSTLAADPPARVADIGMGQGWSSIALARGFPTIHVDGFDLDEASVAAAQANAREAGVDDRVTFQVRDAGDPELAGAYDLALAVECVHDMSDPVSVLRAMRRLVGEGGTVLIVDERVPDTFAPNGDAVERMMYGFSVLHCLPVGMVETPSAETGTVMRRPTFHRYAQEAGFTQRGRTAHRERLLPLLPADRVGTNRGWRRSAADWGSFMRACSLAAHGV